MDGCLKSLPLRQYGICGLGGRSSCSEEAGNAEVVHVYEQHTCCVFCLLDPECLDGFVVISL